MKQNPAAIKDVITTYDLDRIKAIRLLFTYGIAINTFFGLILNYYYPEILDPMRYRMIVNAVIFLALMSTFILSPSEHSIFRTILFFVLSILFLHVTWITAKSGNHPAWMAGWWMTILVCSYLLDKAKWFFVFCIFALAVTWYFNLGQGKDAHIPFVYALFVLASSLILIFFVSRHRYFLVKSLEDKNRLLKEQSLELDKQRMISFNSAKLASMGEIAGGIAHEINNPLTIIQGRIYRVRTKLKTIPSEPELIDECDQISSNIKRISKIIAGIRSFSRDASEEPMQHRDFIDIVTDSLSFVQEKIKAQDIELKIDFNGLEHSRVNCRDVEISQVLVNILLNASQAVKSSANAQEGWINIAVFSSHEKVFAEISNNGELIGEDIQTKIFEPFYTTKEVGEGTGLGLSIALGIIQAHKGQLYLKQNTKHTTFVIELPTTSQ